MRLRPRQYDISPETVPELIRSYLERLVDELPVGSARFIAERDDKASFGATVFRVEPISPAAAPIEVFVPDYPEIIDVVLGIDVHFEIDIAANAHRNPVFHSFQDELAGLCQAALRGDLNERLTYIGAELINSSGTVYIGHTKLKTAAHRATAEGEPKTVNLKYESYSRDLLT